MHLAMKRKEKNGKNALRAASKQIIIKVIMHFAVKLIEHNYDNALGGELK